MSMDIGLIINPDPHSVGLDGSKSDLDEIRAHTQKIMLFKNIGRVSY